MEYNFLLLLFASYIHEDVSDDSILPSLSKPTVVYEISRLVIGYPKAPKVQHPNGNG